MQAQKCLLPRHPRDGPYTPDVGRKLSKPRPAQGSRLLDLRKRAGLSQTELARILGVSQANIALWERSERPPRALILPPLAKALGVDVEDIIGGKPGTHGRANDAVVSRKPGPVGRLRKVFEEASLLPRRQQQKVVDIVTALVHEYRREAG